MYYGYERAWGAIAWGKCEPGSSLAGPVSWRARVAWTMLAVAAVVLILLIVLYVTPLVKP